MPTDWIQMDWRIFLSTFALVFLAELGDKTQLATLAMACQTQARWTVFAGATLALVVVTLASVLLSEVLHRLLPADTMRWIAGGIFILAGVAILLGRS
jgi:putative Ca2+/H+ antiporter (TMEM165/GDT1 family)